MGTGIAYAAAVAELWVEVVEADAGRRAEILPRIRTLLDRGVTSGDVLREQAAAAHNALSFPASLDQVAPGADLIVEAVPERPDLKRSVLAAAEAREPKLLASNTSSIPIAELARGLAAPEKFIGLHFFNPVWKMRLVEVVVGPQTGDAAVRGALEIVEALGKAAVVVKDAPGFATSRLGVLLGLEAIRMVEDGVASAEDIDTAMRLGYNHPVGPLELTDIVGLDVRLDIARALQAAYGDRFAPPDLLVRKVEAGELGKKAGQGFYRWVDGRREEIGRR
jgi:3-hydroxybutyryl-CoA dehydrogenase